MVVASEVNGVMSEGELAKRIEKRRIACDSLIQQLDPLEQIRFCLTTEARIQNKIFRAVVEIEGCEIGSRPALNGQFLSGRNFGVKLLSDFLCDLTLDCEDVVQVAIVLFRPDMGVGASVDQLRIDMKPAAGLACATLQHVRYAKRVSDLAGILFATILHNTRAADHLEIGNFRQLGQNVVLETIGKIGVLRILIETLKRQHSNAPFGR